MACVFVVVAIGRFSDLVPALQGIPLVKLALGTAIIGLAAGWKVLPDFHPMISGTLKIMTALVVLAILSILWSIWPGQSLGFLTSHLPVLIVAMILICKLAGTWPSMRALLLAMVVASCILAIPGLLSFGGGRMSNNSMYDTNDLAYVLLALLPLSLGFVFTAKTWRPRLVFLGVAAMLVVSILLTSSRGGMIALVAVMLLLALDRGRLPDVDARGKPKGRAGKIIGSLLGCIVLAAIVFPQLPAETRQRLSSVFSLESDYNMKAQTGRVQIWKRGMKALGERPIGFGIDAYAMVDLRYGGKMFTAHNSFVQLSIELGVLGFILYLTILLRVWFGLKRARRTLAGASLRATEQVEQAVFCRMLQLSIIGNIIAGMFLSAAYFVVHWTILALSLGCMARVYRCIDEGGAEAPVAAAAPHRRPVIEVGRVLR